MGAHQNAYAVGNFRSPTVSLCKCGSVPAQISKLSLGQILCRMNSKSAASDLGDPAAASQTLVLVELK